MFIFHCHTGTLTASADEFVGTEKGDVFKADSFVTAFGGYKTTLNSSDELDGGAGKDTLNITSDDTSAYEMASATIKNIETITIKGADDVLANVAGSNITGLETISVLKSVDTEVHANSTTDVNVSGATGNIEVSGGKNIVVNDATAHKVITIGETATLSGFTAIPTATNATGTITVTDTNNISATAANNDITIDGGTDVTVTATATANGTADKSGNIEIGTTKQATGDVKVTQNINNDGTVATVTAGNIDVTGGKTVDITVNATVTAKNKNAQGDIAVGSIGVTGDGKTTDVTVKQNLTSTEFVTAAVADIVSTEVVTFKALTSGQTTTVNGLTFTASKDLTAEQVAAAFANLTTADTQSATGITANGFYTGTFNTTAWTSGAANGAVVTFTGAAHNTAEMVKTAGTVDPTSVYKVGTLGSGKSSTTNDITKGAVSVVDNATTDAIKTVTINGFNKALIGVDTTASSVSQLNALTTLTLSNNTKNDVIEVGTTSKTLTLNVDNITSTGTTYINLDHSGNGVAKNTSNATIETLTINATGKDSNFELIAGALKDLTINATAGLDISDTSASYATTNLKTIDVNGAGAVDLGVLTTATALNSFDASGNTGGVTATIETEIHSTALTGTITEYVFSAGNDVVTLSNDVIETKITLGAGDDKITLASGTGIADVVATIDGGTGSNTIAMTAADAQILSSDDKFEGKISNFDKLSINNTPTATVTVDLANMDDISYVISANSGSVATKEVFTANFNTSGTIVGADTVVFDGATINLTAGMTAAQIATAVAGGAYTTYDVTNNSDGTVTFTAKTAGVITPDVAAGNFVITDTDATTAAVVINKTQDGAVSSYSFDITNIALYDLDTITIGATTIFTGSVNTALENAAAILASLDSTQVVIGGITYDIDGSDANTLKLTTTAGNAPATLTYTANNVASNVGFVAGVGSGLLIADTTGAKETFTADFSTSGAIEDADTIVFDGTKITLASGMTQAQIATAVAGQLYTNYTASLTSTNVVTFTAKTNNTVADVVASNFSITPVTSTTTKAAVAVTVTTQGAAAGTTPSLTLDHMANNGTLELTTAGNGVIVTMKDASGNSDTFNIVTGDKAGNVGAVVVNGVETINVTTTDIFTDDGLTFGSTKGDGKDDSNSSSTLVVSADAAKTVNVSGAGDLTLDTTSSVLTKVDASKMTGDLVYTADGATAGTTVLGGSGNDTLTADGENDVLKGGAGNDTFYATYLTKVYGGEGADKFYFATPTQLSKVSTIADLGSGDTIYLVDNAGIGNATDDIVNKFYSAGAQYNANTTTTFEAKVNASLVQTGEGEATWFQHSGNTYIVIDNDSGSGPIAGAVDSYTAGKDVVIEITGLVDLSTASFNATTGTLEIA